MRIRAGFLILAVSGLLMAEFGKETYACVTSENITHNVISSGELKISVDEWADLERNERFPETAVSGIVPGSSVIKVAEVTNESDHPVFIRVDLRVTEDGKEAVSYEDQELLTLSLGDDWERGEDGFYYYHEAVAPRDVTTTVFTEVLFSKDLLHEDQGKLVRLKVNAAAVQSEHNGESALLAAGWPSWN